MVFLTAGAPKEAEDISAPVDAVEDVKVISAPVEEEKGISPIVIGVGAIAAIGIGAVLFKKKTA